MPITPIGYALSRSTASELNQLQQQLAEVDPNDPQAIMQLQTQIAAVKDQIAQVEKQPGPAGQNATLYMGTVTTLPPGSTATADMVDGHLNLGIPEGEPGQDAVLELGSVTTGSQASAEILDGVLNLTLPEPVDGKDATLEMGTLTTLAPGAQATASITDGKLNLGIPAGRQGVPGKDATLTAGTVTTGSPGQPASASIDGGMLNLVIPQGQTGAPGAAGKDGQSIIGPVGPVGPVGPSGKDGAAGRDGQPGAVGPQGPAGPALSIGMTTTGAPGSTAAATVSENRLNLTIPRGDTGATGAAGKDAQAFANVAAPTAISPLPALGTAYQVAKTSNLSVVVEASYTVTLASVMEDIIELRIGTEATVATGGGVLVASWRASFTGIGVMIGAGMADRAQLTAIVPGSMYWALRRTKGTASTVVSAVIQPLV